MYKILLKSGTHRLVSEGRNVCHGEHFVTDIPFHEKDPSRYQLISDVPAVAQPKVVENIDLDGDGEVDEVSLEHLSKLSVAKLEEFAETNEIDLEGAGNKKEKIEKILEAFS